MKIIATVSLCVQTGTDEWTTIRKGNIFDEDKSIKDIINWAENIFQRKIEDINMIQFSTFTE